MHHGQGQPQQMSVLDRIVRWALERPDIHAVILTSSLVRPGGPVDNLSDYDVILAVTNAERFGKDDAWNGEYGRPMVRWGDQSALYGLTTYFRGVVYADYAKIDWSIWPVELLARVAEAPKLPDGLDDGYRVLLDKTGATAAWLPASHRAFIPSKPTEAEFLAVVEELWWTATYVAKSLWRDELMFARFCLDYDIKLQALRRLLEWRFEVDHDWSVRPGVLGRGMKRLLPSDLWAELESTYVGSDIEENWQALFRTMGLVRRIATEVAAALGYRYPESVDAEVTRYLEWVRALGR